MQDCIVISSHWPYYDSPNFDFSKGIFCGVISYLGHDIQFLFVRSYFVV